jgi:hypothetical protein
MVTIEIELNGITYEVHGECEYVVRNRATWENPEEGELRWVYRPVIIDAWDSEGDDYDYSLEEEQEVKEMAYERKDEFKI